MSPRFLVSALLFLLLACPGEAEVSERRKAEITQALGRNTREDVDLLPAEEKEFIRQWCNGLEQDNLKAGIGYLSYYKQLLQAGDPAAMEKLVTEFRSGSAIVPLSDLASSRQPLLISRVVAGMFIDEPAARRMLQDVSRPPTSVCIAGCVCQVVAESHAFPQQVRDWATQLRKDYEASDNGERCRTIMRKWYTANQSALENARWSEVSVGEAFPQTARLAPATPLATDIPAPKKNIPPVPGSGTVPTAHSSWWPWFAAGLAIVLLVVWLLATRKRAR